MGGGATTEGYLLSGGCGSTKFNKVQWAIKNEKRYPIAFIILNTDY
jgi:hypothetical protein